MFKSRLSKWGLDKNRKDHEMRALYRKTKRRDRDGKETVATVRGRRVQLDTALHYFERKGIRLSDLDQESGASQVPSTPPDIRCYTPVSQWVEPQEQAGSLERDVAAKFRDSEERVIALGDWDIGKSSHGPFVPQPQIRLHETPCDNTNLDSYLHAYRSPSARRGAHVTSGKDFLAEILTNLRSLQNQIIVERERGIFERNQLLRSKYDSVRMVRLRVHDVVSGKKEMDFGTVLSIRILAMLEVRNSYHTEKDRS